MAISCLVFVVLANFKASVEMKLVLFSILVLLACPEKLASIANTVAVERDWVSLVPLGLVKQDVEGVDRDADMEIWA